VTQTFQLDHPLQRIVSRFKCAIESERYDEAQSVLAEYHSCITSLCKKGDGAPSKDEVMGLMNWARRTLMVARAHTIDQYQLLSDSRVYASFGEPDRKMYHLTL